MTFLIKIDGLVYLVTAKSVIAALNHPRVSPYIDAAKTLSVERVDVEVLGS